MGSEVHSVLLAFLTLSSSFKTNRVEGLGGLSDNGGLVELRLEKGNVIHEVDKRFLSFTLDSYDLYRHWDHIHLENERLVTLTKYLQPAFLRVGGTTADAIIFAPEGEGAPSPDNRDIVEQANGRGLPGDHGGGSANITTERIYGTDLLRLNTFIQKTGSDLIFDLNALVRRKRNWDPRNAKEMLGYMSRERLKVFGWELGNEPNHYPYVFNETIKPKQLAKDFGRLRGLLTTFPAYRNSIVIGPDLTHLSRRRHSVSMAYMRAFLRNSSPNVLQRVTFHQYYFDGSEATIEDFFNTTIMDGLSSEISAVQSLVRKHLPETPIWIGETSSGWGGGAKNISDTFAGTFLWLDKLGTAAAGKVDVVMKQSLMGGWYGLINKEVNPTPNYFVSFVYKSLVGRKVIEGGKALRFIEESGNVTTRSRSRHNLPPSIRLYLHCGPVDLPGSVTLFGLNVDPAAPVSIRIKGLAGKRVQEYLLQAPNDDRTSKTVLLNGKVLKVDRLGRAPILEPRLRRRVITLSPLTVGFWVLQNANFRACL